MSTVSYRAIGITVCKNKICFAVSPAIKAKLCALCVLCG
jgi:hypothetical protein